MEEIWKDIKNYEGYYQVSNLGNVRSIDRYIYHSDGKIVKRRGKILCPYIDKAGYMQIHFYLNQKQKHYKIHRLVGQTFILNLNNKPQINHINGIKTDNRVCNLEWVSQSDNQKHAYKIGLQTPVDNGFKKSVIIQDNIGCRSYFSIRDMCRVEHLDRRHVQRVLSGKFKKYKNLKLYYNEQ